MTVDARRRSGYIVRMNPERVLALLRAVSAGQTTPEEAKEALGTLPFADLGFARVDHHRALRQGTAEVIFAEGKTPEQVRLIFSELASRGSGVLATRVSEEQAALVLKDHPSVRYNPMARTIGQRASSVARQGSVTVVTAGTSDLPVAEEALETLHACGVEVQCVADVGVAGLHRLLDQLEGLRTADVLIVVAGMEGALASVVGGLASAPVVAVPTSVGYGAALGGLTALMGMLTSCASGVTCVNIDNGFGAAMAAVRILDGRKGGA